MPTEGIATTKASPIKGGGCHHGHMLSGLTLSYLIDALAARSPALVRSDADTAVKLISGTLSGTLSAGGGLR